MPPRSYITLDSTYRNRGEYPYPADYIVNNSRAYLGRDARDPISDAVILFPYQTPYGSTNYQWMPIAFYNDVLSETTTSVLTERLYYPYLYSINDSDVLFRMDALPIASTTPTTTSIQPNVDFPNGTMNPGSANNFYIHNVIERLDTNETREIVGYSYSTDEVVLQTMTLVAYTVINGIAYAEVDDFVGNEYPPSNVDRFYQGKTIRFASGDERLIVNFYLVPINTNPTFQLTSPLADIPTLPQHISILTTESWIVQVDRPFSTTIPPYPAYYVAPPSNVLYTKVPLWQDSKVFAIDLVRHADNTVGVVYQTYQNVMYMSSSDTTGLVWERPPIEVAFGPYADAASHGISASIINGYPAILFTTNTGSIPSLQYVRAQDTNGTTWNVPTDVISDVTLAVTILESTAYVSADDSSAWSGVTWAPELTRYVAVSTSTSGTSAMYSTTGTSWTTAATSTEPWRDLVWAPELTLFVAVSNTTSGTTRVMTSSDGITWSSGLGANTNAWSNVVWAPEQTRFVAVSNGGAGSRTMWSNTGLGGSWTALAPPMNSNNWRGLVWAPELTLFVATATSGTNRVMYTSDPTVSWTTALAADESSSWESVAWAPELTLFVAVARTGTSRIMTSPDGIAWTTRQSPGSLTDYRDIVWAPEHTLFVIVGSSGAIATSYDGISWVTQTAPNSDTYSSITWSASQDYFISVANSGSDRVLRSYLTNVQHGAILTILDEPYFVPMQPIPPGGIGGTPLGVDAGYPEFVCAAPATYLHEGQILVVRGTSDYDTPTWRVIPTWENSGQTIATKGRPGDINSALYCTNAQYVNPLVPDNQLSLTNICYANDNTEGGIGILFCRATDTFGFDGTFPDTNLTLSGLPKFGSISTEITSILPGDPVRLVSLLSLVWHNDNGSDQRIITAKQTPFADGTHRIGYWGGYPFIPIADGITNNNVLVTNFNYVAEYLTGQGRLTATYINGDTIYNVPYTPDFAMADTTYSIDSTQLNPVPNDNLIAYASLIQQQTSINDISPLIAYQSTDTFVWIMVPQTTTFTTGVQYRIRNGPAPISNTVLSGSTTTVVFPSAVTSSEDDAYTGWYVWLHNNLVNQLPSPFYPLNAYRPIASYDGATHTATLGSPIDVDLINAVVGDESLYAFELLPIVADNYSPIVYSGTMVSVQQEVCYEVQLVSLVLPNITLATGQGNRIAFYPYVDVVFTDLSDPTRLALITNNPHEHDVLFRVPITNIVDPVRSTFVALSGGGLTQTIFFRPNTTYRITIRLPNGERFETLLQDTTPPFPPNPDLQVSAIFSLTRLANNCCSS